MKLHIIGDWIGSSSGYASHTRGLTNALANINPDTSLDCPKPVDWVHYVSDQELKMINTPFTEDNTTVMIGQPQFWKLTLSNNPKRFAGFLVWEGQYIPLFWLKHLVNNRINWILVPSTHVKQSILNTIENALNQRKTVFKEDIKGIIDKIHVIPHGVNEKLFYPEKTTKNKPFTFLMCKGWSQGLYDRGGIQWGIKAFNEEFNKNENVCLKIKINTSYNMPNWSLQKQIDELKLEKDKAPMYINIDNVEYNKLRKFYIDGDVFVSCSMADAFDLPVLEAMACGLPSIVTAHNGHCDFINRDNSWIIEKGEFVEWSKEIQYEGNKWFKPDINEIRKKMRYAFEHQKEVEEKGLQAVKDSKKWTWENSAKKLLKILT